MYCTASPTGRLFIQPIRLCQSQYHLTGFRVYYKEFKSKKLLQDLLAVVCPQDPPVANRTAFTNICSLQSAEVGELAHKTHPFASPGTDLGPAALEVKVLEVHPALTSLFPDEGLRRGSVLSVSGLHGSTALLLAILSTALSKGSWAAVVGIPTLGMEAASDLGIDLSRLILVPNPAERWLEVVATLIDALDVVVITPPAPCQPAGARRLISRARRRESLLVIVDSYHPGRYQKNAMQAQSQRPNDSARQWPEAVDLQIDIISSFWQGLGSGDGTLQRRLVKVRSHGRRGAARERFVELWLPDSDGSFSAIESPDGRP